MATGRYHKGTVVTPREAHGYWQQLVHTENTLTSRFRKQLPTVARSSAASVLSTSIDRRAPLQRVTRRRNLTFSTELHTLLTSSVNSKQKDSSPKRIPISSDERRLRTTQHRSTSSQCDHIPSPERPLFHPDAYYRQFAGRNCLKPNQREPDCTDLDHVLDVIQTDPRLSAFEKAKRVQAVVSSRREQAA